MLVRWNGGWVRPDRLRASLIGLLDAISVKAQAVAGNPVDESDRADRLAQAVTRHAGRSGMSRLMRARLGSLENMQGAAYVFGALAIGTPVVWENHEPQDGTASALEIFERASGIYGVRSDDIAGNGPLLHGADSGVRSATTYTTTQSWRHPSRLVDQTELVAARAEWDGAVADPSRASVWSVASLNQAIGDGSSTLADVIAGAESDDPASACERIALREIVGDLTLDQVADLDELQAAAIQARLTATGLTPSVRRCDVS